MVHPVACLIMWTLFAVAAQLYGASALLVSAALMILAGRRWLGRWWLLVRRARWLLLTLWVILAYGVPGDLWLGYAWAPSVEGMESASLHAGRLLLLLGSLAWLFDVLPHERFLASLWVAVSPFRSCGLDADRTVARLGLVFDYLDHAPPKGARGSWRQLLELPQEEGRLLETVSIDVPRWKAADSWVLGGAAVILTLLGVLP